MNGITEYFKNNPSMAIVLSGLAVFIVILICIFVFLRNKAQTALKAQEAKEKRRLSEEEKQTEAKPAPTPPSPSIPRSAPIVPTANKREKKTTRTTKTDDNKTSPSPTPPQPKTEKNVKKATGQTKTNGSNKQKEETPTAEAKDEKPKKKTKQIPNRKRDSENTKKGNQREGAMLLDELKDVDTELDFYEEDETDQVARYSGKWVICRIITNDQATAEEETFFFELHASNGEKLLSSEEYTTYNGALRGIETHKANILRGNLKITLSKKGDYIFKLLSGKNLLLCMGENYPTRAACESAIESAKRFAKTAIIDENIQDVIVKVPVEDDSAPLPLPDGYNGKWIIGRNEGVDGEPVYFFELFANNGEKLLSSEEYTTYIGAVNGIQTHKANIAAGNFRVSLTKRGDYIYKLLNRNGQLLCLGEHYKTKRRCLNAVESVKRFAKNSPVLTDPKLIALESEKAPDDIE